jgi:FkbM family methyltransferase
MLREARESRRRSKARLVLTKQGYWFTGSSAMATGAFEHAETQFVTNFLPQCDLFVDVGANVGYYSCLACSLGKSVVAIEPLIHNLEYLYTNLVVNGWTDAEVVPVALSKSAGIAKLSGGSTGASLIRTWAGSSETWSRFIPLSTLDTVLGSRFNGKRVLIKIDVEGAEFEVMLGSVLTLRMDPPPTWLVEVCLTENHPAGLNPNFLQVFNIFWANGYKALALEAGGFRPVGQSDVERWVQTRQREFGNVSYIFHRGDLLGPK